jgi:hypothetical protein
MADLFCKKCGEPWDGYGVRMALKYDQGDMTQEEAIRFVKGEGCPSCHFGKDKEKLKKIDDIAWLMELYDEFSG